MIPRRATQWILLAAIFLGAATLRVAPGWEAVYGSDEVNFQGGDAYYHLRSIHALTANFPTRPGFDPYAIYPRGMNVVTGPLFDYAVSGAAMMLAAGAPSPTLVEHVAAWIPPLVGSLAVLPVFLLGRLLLNAWAGLMAAAWIAVCSGHTVVYAKLGFADHHVFEALFYGLALYGLALAVQGDGDTVAKNVRRGLAAGLALGCALLNRPAAAFLLVMFGSLSALLAGADLYWGRPLRQAALPVAVALACGSTFLLGAGSGAWGTLPYIAGAAGVVAVMAGWQIARVVRVNGWPAWTWLAALFLVGAAGLAGVWLASPGTIHAAKQGFTDAIAGGEGRLVGEVRSLVRINGVWTLRPLVLELGLAGLLAVPAFGALGLAGWRRRDRALLLVAGTGALTYCAAILQARMSIYVSLNLAVALGWWIWNALESASSWARVWRGAAILVLLFLPSALLAVGLVKRDMGLSEHWRSAMSWLQTSTPDPLGDPSAYLRYYPRLAKGERFAFPADAYSVMTWWDRGYWVMTRGRRPPASNGTQSGARQVAAFYTSTQPAEALALADELAARYVIVDQATPVVPLAVSDFSGSQFRAMTGWAEVPLETYLNVYDLPQNGGGAIPVYVFYPEYFRSMAARLYLYDGEAYRPKNATTVFALRDGRDAGGRETISSQQTFETYERAVRYVDARPDQNLIIGTMNPYKSCAPLERVEGFLLAHDSAPKATLGADGKPQAVKVFERIRSGSASARRRTRSVPVVGQE